MEYSILAEAFEKMESTRKRLELTQFLVELFEKTPEKVISKIVYHLETLYLRNLGSKELSALVNPNLLTEEKSFENRLTFGDARDM